MRRPAPASALLSGWLVTLACVSGGCAGGTGSAAAGDPAARPLDAEVFPLAPRESIFALGRSATRTLRVVPDSGSAADLTFEGGPGADRRLRATRTADAILLSAGPGLGTELVRLGAAPGDVWTSGAETVRFEGWERIEVPAGLFDAARISTRSGPEALQRVETWWLARGVGIVRLRADHGGIFAEEMQLLTQ